MCVHMNIYIYIYIHTHTIPCITNPGECRGVRGGDPQPGHPRADAHLREGQQSVSKGTGVNIMQWLWDLRPSI